uniref:Ribosomal protein L32 n=1 Tax=Viburnum burejaeticum TaxID=1190427 RepID=A0A7M3T1K6_9DIPS|nr:ribosomal protein L32 [Viburnum burejaeticum]QES95203.1 ribosomal protein L32 [Viburnum burejaeticum]
MHSKERFVLNNRCLSHPTRTMSNLFILKWQFQKNVLLYQKSVFVKIFGKGRDIGQR